MPKLMARGRATCSEPEAECRHHTRSIPGSSLGLGLRAGVALASGQRRSLAQKGERVSDADGDGQGDMRRRAGLGWGIG